MKLSTLTVCLNEEEMILESLEYAQTIADEIVVVDGGSTDKTVEIIKMFANRSNVPVELFSKSMDESFAEQRNFAMARCTGDWILQLDADEKYELKLKKQWKVLASRPDIIGYSFPTYHLWKDEKHYVNEDADPHIRLFKNTPDIKYVGDVHEFLTLRGHPLIPHPSHFNKFTEKYVRYIADIRLLHYTFLRPKKNVEKKVKTWKKKFYKKSSGAGIPVDDNYFKKPRPKKVFKIGN